MTTALASPSVGYGRRPLSALAKAEYLQFRRNKTLVFMGTVFPVGIPLFTYFVGRDGGAPTPALTATTIELFVLFALLFVQYYSVLSMVTTRRSEGVLKRLRTGEASDWQILTAPAVPGSVLTLAGAVAVAGIVYGTGAPAPVNPVATLLALAGGLVVFSLLALATSGVTKNAEAAQITSIPVMTVAMVGLASLRGILPDRLATVADWTPFAAISDLVWLGAAGTPATTDTSATALDFAGTFAEFGRPLATLALWTVLALALVYKTFRWDDRG
ncbi:ABC transporter permease [Rhodococcus triatomae]|uniref:ABC-2 type transport system permease protein n=1 Tax=Rhodococcus triatomae TaxID=300028 RepID=A0A1G8PKP4_9NOCA|nr:ABC transporter permease [Rhodococcus triatomae]QNG20127.1 ABC transporter permease [Rhodococcus triatomae]QNG23957.1 ABC transporter permease [Rhodococcus triatomae]SDI92765.1 ABC-2 type transport system permease protein [Rhodococcus triatomae]